MGNLSVQIWHNFQHVYGTAFQMFFSIAFSQFGLPFWAPHGPRIDLRSAIFSQNCVKVVRGSCARSILEPFAAAFGAQIAP